MTIAEFDVAFLAGAMATVVGLVFVGAIPPVYLTLAAILAVMIGIDLRIHQKV